MKKALKKQAAFVMLSAALAVQTGFPGYAATSVMGSWANEDGGWKFYGSDHQAYTGWVKTESGWYYLNPADGKMATGWQKIDNFWYYFDTAAEGVEGRMHTGWYKSPENTWYFFENGSGSATEGHMVTGWQWIDGYCYYFSAEASEQPGTQGAMYANKRTPDGYPTNADGQWTQDGQATYRPGLGFSTKSSSSMGTSSSSSSGSDGSSSSGSNSNNGSNTTPDTPSTPNQPDKPGENPDTPDEKEEYQYLLMNIPYEEFYAAEIENNAEGVDAVTSATKAKPRTGNLVAGSYHANSDGSNISGVTFPVKIKKGTDLSKFKQITDSDSLTITVTNRGKEVTTEYNGKDALFESADYSYYVLSEVPSYYKEVSVDADGNLSFGKAEGTKQKVDDVSANLSTTSNYGDYQLSFSGMPDLSKDTVYGVVLHTEEGEDYGLRHLENIWLRTQLAWSAGFTTQSHGSPLAFEHYQSMMGKKLTGVTYYTSKGIMEIPFAESVYVPVKIASGLMIKNGTVDGGEEGISVSGAEFPADFEAEYQVKNSLGKQVDAFYDIESGKLTWEGSLTAGSYTLTVTDKSGKYAPVSGSFVLETEAVPAAFTLTEEGWKVTKAEGVSDEDFRAYLSAITNVKVGEKNYTASGRGAVKIIDTMTGEIDFTAKSNDKEIFENGKRYVLEITATGYKKNLTGTVTASEKKPMTTAKAGKATVQTEDGKYVSGTYQAKVLVTTDADGKIVSIKDNGTEPGANRSFWSMAIKIFEKMAGKTVDEIDGVDTISGATVSSNAIKKAVRNALPEPEKPEDTNMNVIKFVVDGVEHTYYYAAYVPLQTPTLIVKGEDVTKKAKTIRANYSGKAYYYAEDDQKLTGMIYGLADVPYAEFYAGEKIGYTGPWTSSEDISTGENTYNSVMRNGGYDAISSATTAKYGMYTEASYGEKTDSGYKINGVQTNIGISADLFVRARILSEVGVSSQGNTFSILNSMTNNGRDLTAKEPASYKTMYYDGMLSKMQYSADAPELNTDGITATLKDKSRYGHYKIDVENLPSEIKGDTNVLGVLVKTGNRMADIYGLEHLENIWKDANELALAVKDGVVSHGNKISYERYSTLEGQTIESIVYLLSDYQPVEILVNLYCPKLLADNQGIEAESVSYQADADMSVSIKLNLPSDYDPQIDSVMIGKKELDANAYRYADGVLTLKEGMVTPGAYTIRIRDGEAGNKGYQSVQAVFAVNSALQAEDVKFSNNRLVISGNSGVTVDEYRKAITAVYVDGKEMKNVPAEQLILEDGSINFDLEYQRKGKTIKVFKNGAEGTYKLKLEADGYPAIEAEVGSGSVLENTLADGVWYGTATESFYYEMNGPDTIKAVIKDGKIESVESVLYKEDNVDQYRKGIKILDFAVGLSDISDLKQQLTNRSGSGYDAVSGATQTAKSQMSALENALERSAKYQRDGIEQNINYMEFETRPKTWSTTTTLDLSDSVLKVHLKNGTTKYVKFDEFEEYGITTNPTNGTEIPQNGQTIEIKFQNEDGLITIPAYIYAKEKLVYRYPTRMQITYSDQSTQDIKLDQDEFRYKMSAEKTIRSVDLYDGDEKIVSGVFDSLLNEWRMDLDTVNAGAEYTGGWKYKLYKLVVQMIADNSGIVSASIDVSSAKTSYAVGEKLDLSGVKAVVKTEKGNEKTLSSWSELQKNGFTSSLNNEYEFTADDIGTRTITISIVINDKTIEESFKIEVAEQEADADAQIPAKIVLYSGDRVAKEIEVDRDAFVESNGYLILRDEVISSDYKDTWKAFTAEVYNKNGDLLNSNVISKPAFLRIVLPDYKDYQPEYGGYIMLTFSATGDPLEPEEISQTPARVVFSVDGEDLAEVTISEEDLIKDGGYVRKSGVELPETYKGKLDKLTVTVYNEDDDSLESTIGTIRSGSMQIQFPMYTEYDSEGGALTVMFSFVSVEDESVLESDVTDAADNSTVEIEDELQQSKDETADSDEIISSDDTDDSEDASESDDDNDQIKEEEKSEDETVGTDKDTKNGSDSADENDAEDAKDDADEEEAEEI